MTVDVRGYTDNEMDDLFEAYVSKPADTVVSEYLARPGSNTDEWIYPGLVCDSYTGVIGLPKAGKSRFAVNLAAAYTRGEPLLGIEPTTGSDPKNVLIIGTEGNLEKEYAGRLQSAGADLDRVAVVRVPTNGPVPQDLYTRASYGAIDLVIVDNTDGFKGGESNVSDEAASNVKAVVEPFNFSGVPVVVIHHANKGTGNVPHDAMGNTTYKGMFREMVGVYKMNGSAVTLKSAGNVGPPIELKAKFDEDHRIHLLDTADLPKEEQAPKGDEALKRIAELAVSAPADLKGKSAIGRYVAEQLKAEGIKNRQGNFFTPKGITAKLNGMCKSNKSSLRYVEETGRFAS